MQFISDFHIHSRFSRGCSINTTLVKLEEHAKMKGIGLLGTGDFTHPVWFKEISEHLIEDEGGDGILRSKNGFPFILTSELSLIYSQDGKGRRVHHVLLAPNKEVVQQINEALLKKGRLDYDGRPIFGFSSPELVEMMRSISDQIEIIPAHIWTPWFAIFGSNSGFDSVEECFGEKSKFVHALETGMSCYDPKTEILTDNGWKKVSEVKFSDEICTLNLEKNQIEYQLPLKLFKYSYAGKMYKLKTKRIDLLVTPNHKLLYAPCDFRKKPLFSLKNAEFLFNKSKRFKKDGIWIGKTMDYFILPEVKMRHGSQHYSGFRIKKEKKLSIHSWLKFFGFWIAEGWTTEGKEGDYGVYLANSERDIIKEMEEILTNFGYDVYHYKNRNLETLRIRDYQLFFYLRQFGKASNKFIPKEIKILSKELLQLFFDYYIKGDGNIYGRNLKGLRATTISKLLRNDLQEIALKIGISAYYKLHNKKGTPIVSLPIANSKGYRQSEDSWTINFIRKNIHTVMPSTTRKWNRIEKWENYTGFVYCLEVPNHVIYIRRNGIPAWCGNSDPAMNWRLSKLDKYNLVSFSDSHSFKPHRLGREATVFELEKLSYSNIIKAIKNNDDLKARNRIDFTIETDPAYGKYHFDGHRACGIVLEPKDSLKQKGICPVCKKKLTLGVAYRIEQLADRPEGFVRKNAIGFKKLIPLQELIAVIHGSSVESKKVLSEYAKMLQNLGSENEILLNTGFDDLVKIVDPKLAELILLSREGKLQINPGYDGVYGQVVLEGREQKKEELKKKNLNNSENHLPKKVQLSLGEF